MFSRARSFLLLVAGGFLLAGCESSSTAPRNHPPDVQILSPADGSNFLQGDTVHFSGTATDPEDGDLFGHDLVWSSNLDGRLATGRSFATHSLSVGTHTIRLRAVDGAQDSTVAQETVTVRQNEPPRVTITLPEDGAVIPHGDSVHFQGDAVDPEGAVLADTALVWTSDLDGWLGTGRTFTRNDLSVGVHTIELRSRDPLGAADSAYVTVSIVAGIQVLGGQPLTTAAVAEPVPVEIRVVGPDGAPVAGGVVTWTPESGCGEIVSGDAITDADGHASAVWRLGASADVQHLNVQAGDYTLRVAGTVAISAYTHAEFGTWNGDSARATMAFFDRDSVALSSHPVWKSINPGVLQADADGNTYGVAVGTTELSATVQGSEFRLPARVRPHITGQVLQPLGQPMPHLLVIAQTGNVADTAAVPSDGTVDFKPRRIRVWGWASLALVPTDDPAPVHPMWIPAHPQDLTTPLKIVLVPRKWTIEKGKFAGTTVAIDMNTAFVTQRDYLPSYYGGTYQRAIPGRQATDFTVYIKSFAPGDLPMRLGFSHSMSDPQVIKEDSAEIWSYAQDMEQVFGRDLFELIPDPGSGWGAPGTLRHRDLAVFIDTATGYVQASGGSWCDADRWAILPAETPNTLGWSQGTTNQMDAHGCDISSGIVNLPPMSRYYSGAAAGVQHELMHVLGVGHGCAWPSLQSRCYELQSFSITADDVAYWEVLQEVSAVARENHTQYGLLYALFGERKVWIGLEPVPDYNQIPDQ